MEIWKDIKEYEGYYQVSNLGRIKSLSRIVDNHSGFKKKLKEKNAFLIRVMEQPKIWIKGTTDVTGESG